MQWREVELEVPLKSYRCGDPVPVRIVPSLTIHMYRIRRPDQLRRSTWRPVWLPLLTDRSSPRIRLNGVYYCLVAIPKATARRCPRCHHYSLCVGYPSRLRPVVAHQEDALDCDPWDETKADPEARQLLCWAAAEKRPIPYRTVPYRPHTIPLPAHLTRLRQRGASFLYLDCRCRTVAGLEKHIGF